MSFDEDPPPESRLGPAPAPLDLGRLEMDARAAAAKHVARLLQVRLSGSRVTCFQDLCFSLIGG